MLQASGQLSWGSTQRMQQRQYWIPWSDALHQNEKLRLQGPHPHFTCSRSSSCRATNCATSARTRINCPTACCCRAVRQLRRPPGGEAPPDPASQAAARPAENPAGGGGAPEAPAAAVPPVNCSLAAASEASTAVSRAEPPLPGNSSPMRPSVKRSKFSSTARAESCRAKGAGRQRDSVVDGRKKQHRSGLPGTATSTLAAQRLEYKLPKIGHFSPKCADPHLEALSDGFVVGPVDGQHAHHLQAGHGLCI